MEIYISFDIETDGPVPGLYSMLSLGCVAYTKLEGGGYHEISCWTRNLSPLKGGGQHPDTMHWWLQFPKTFEKVCKDRISPERAMYELDLWCHELKSHWKSRHLIPVAGPIGFDFTFVNWYAWKFTGRGPFLDSHNGLDLRSLAMPLYKCEYRAKNPVRDMQVTNPEPHIAINDAREQGEILCALLKKAGI